MAAPSDPSTASRAPAIAGRETSVLVGPGWWRRRPNSITRPYAIPLRARARRVASLVGERRAFCNDDRCHTPSSVVRGLAAQQESSTGRPAVPSADSEGKTSALLRPPPNARPAYSAAAGGHWRSAGKVPRGATGSPAVTTTARISAAAVAAALAAVEAVWRRMKTWVGEAAAGSPL